jgi:predicted amidohydrolase YtcJ
MYQMQSLLRSGAALSFGSDWPVSSVKPLEGIQAAVTREYEGKRMSPEESLTVEQALDAYSIAVQKQLGSQATDEQIKLSNDPRLVPAQEIQSIEILEVTRDGETIWSK